MPHGAVQPLKISKANSSPSPSKAHARPLSEVGAMGIRRNSPSFNQTTKKIIDHGIISNGDSSPFDPSPAAKNSPHVFWKNRENVSPTRLDIENIPVQNSSPSLHRRSSIENLKKVSKVTKSSMFAKEQEVEYNPDSSVLVERPLASNRPFSVQGTTWDTSTIDSPHTRTNSYRGHRRTESNSQIPVYSPQKETTKPPSPSRNQVSPQKSSLVSNSRYGQTTGFNPMEGTWSDDDDFVDGQAATTPRGHLRQYKSVTFDAAPPTINEYEQVTEPSIASESREGSYDSEEYDMDESFERENSYDRDDSFDESLEDADKTPVVLPEDWRFMSPQVANKGLAHSFDDPFENNEPPSPSDESHPYLSHSPSDSRSNSGSSNGANRPLPQVPFAQSSTYGRDSLGSKSDALNKAQRSLPTPPRPASVSKAEILGMKDTSMPLSERLRLLSLQELSQKATPSPPSAKTTGASRDSPARSQVHSEAVTEAIEPSVNEYEPPPRPSRESILRLTREEHPDEYLRTEDLQNSSVAQDSGMLQYVDIHPDEPIPSRETSSNYTDNTANGGIGARERIVDLYAAREPENLERPVSPVEESIESSVIHHDVVYDDTDEVSVCSDAETEKGEGVRSVSAEAQETAQSQLNQPRMSLPEFTVFGGDDDFSFGLESYMTPSPPLVEQSIPKAKLEGPTHVAVHDVDTSSVKEEPMPRASTPLKLESSNGTAAEIKPDEPGTPDSVIHHVIDYDLESYELTPEPEEEPEAIPDPEATIKAPGANLKTRPSISPADVLTMAATRRHVSGEMQLPQVPESKDTGAEMVEEPAAAATTVSTDFNRRRSLRKIEVPLEGELGLGLDQEFERLIEAQKKGYLTRESAKVVVASNRQPSDETKVSETGVPGTAASTDVRETKSAGNSPRKPSVQTWKTEPWNGRIRRQSTRRSNIIPDKRTSLGPTSPTSEQDNSKDQLDDVSTQMDEDDSIERGRLFVKVVSVKELDLPLPKNEQCRFQLTLDNGLHCVTTSWLELGRTAPIGQEFELVVFDDLEFQLTLATKLERPTSQSSSIEPHPIRATPTKAQKTSGLSRFLGGNKKKREEEKRKELEAQAQAEAARQRQLQAEAAKNVEPTQWDLQSELVGSDGSFARAYVSLQNHEKQAFGRPYTVSVPCYNEWAVEDKSVSNSTRSKLGGTQRRPPYQIGKLELQLLYIPRPKDVDDEHMPKSISAAVRQLKEAETKTTVKEHEGHLSQQGGDCPYWRRRYFKLKGPKLTAYHETTRQPRVSISLAKAAKLIDDRSSLTKAEGSATKKGGRRKSAFAEEDEAYTFVEEGFRIRFANGEVIDFYADSRADKEGWMKALSEVIGKDVEAAKPSWTNAVLARERSLAAKSEALKHQLPQEKAPVRGTSKSAPTTPAKKPAASTDKPLPPAGDKASAAAARPRSPIKKEQQSPTKRNSAVLPSTRSPQKEAGARRQAVKSMVF